MAGRLSFVLRKSFKTEKNFAKRKKMALVNCFNENLSGFLGLSVETWNKINMRITKMDRTMLKL